MEETEIKKLWQAYTQQYEQAKLLNTQSWVLNLQTKEFINTQKAKSSLNALVKFKGWMVALGILWESFLLFLLVNSISFEKIFFVISVSMIALFNLVAIIVYIRHMIMIRQIDQSESIIEAQSRITQLQTSTLQVTRILFLQAPFYCSWWFTPAWIAENDAGFWLISLPVFLFFTFLSLWLYRNINYKNVHKKWFRMLFNSPEWTNLGKAISFYKEIEAFRQERTALAE